MPDRPELFSADAVEAALSWVAAVLYLLGLVTLIVRRRHGGHLRAERLDHVPVLLGFLAHLGSVVMRGQIYHRFPVANLHESAVFLAFLLACAYLIAALRFRFPAVEWSLLALAFVFLVLSFLLPDSAATAAPPHSRWFVFHTLLSFLGVSTLSAACVVSVLYLIGDVQLKNKRPRPMLRFLPSLVACDRTALRLLELGFPLLTLGLFAGWMWSHEQASFRLGPKETLAILAWLLYALLLFARLVAGWQGRRAAVLSVTAAAAAFGAVLSIRL